MKFKKGLSLAIIIVFIALFICSDSSAFFESGNELVQKLREYEKGDKDPTIDLQESAYYMGFVMGVYDATTYAYNSPAGTTKGQIWAIVGKYLKENPEKWSEPAADLVRNALRKAFPKR